MGDCGALWAIAARCGRLRPCELTSSGATRASPPVSSSTVPAMARRSTVLVPNAKLRELEVPAADEDIAAQELAMSEPLCVHGAHQLCPAAQPGR